MDRTNLRLDLRLENMVQLTILQAGSSKTESATIAMFIVSMRSQELTYIQTKTSIVSEASLEIQNYQEIIIAVNTIFLAVFPIKWQVLPMLDVGQKSDDIIAFCKFANHN